MKNRILPLCILLLTCILPVSANWNPFIVHFDKLHYGENTQVWQMSTKIPGWLMVAGQGGFLQFDGSVWQHYNMPKGSPVRAVLPDLESRRVYVGGLNMSGYFAPQPSGTMAFTNFFPPKSEITIRLANVWNILHVGDMVYLQGDYGIARISHLLDKPDYIEAPDKITASAIVSGSLYIGCQSGLYVLIGKNFFPVHGTESFVGHTFRSIIPYDDKVILVTSDGLYLYANQSISTFIPKLHKLISDKGPFCAALYRGLLAIGTVKNGVYCYDMLSRKITNVSEANGLRNNTVLSVSFDERGFLWAGMDRGIDYIMLSSPLTNLYTFPRSYGTGYAAYQSGDDLYLGTNRGLYYTSYQESATDTNAEIYEVPGTEGQVWGISEVDGDVFCMHDKGLLKVNKLGVEQIDVPVGSFCAIPMKGQKEMFVGHYSGISLITKDDQGKWSLKKYFESIQGSFMKLLFYKDSTVWGINDHTFMHIRFSKDWQQITHSKEYSIDSIAKITGSSTLAMVHDTLRLATRTGIYYYNDQTDTFCKDTHLENQLAGDVPYRLLSEKNGDVWALSDQMLSHHHNDMMAPVQSFSNNYSFDVLVDFVSGHEKMVWTNERHVIMPYDKGFAMLNVEQAKQQQKLPLSVHVEELAISANNDSVIYKHHIGKHVEKPVISWNNNVLRFVFGVNLVANKGEIKYRYRFSSKEEWTQWTERPTKEFAGLYEDDYTLHLQARTISGEIAETRFYFKVLPPWWRTSIAYAVYTILSLVILFVIIYFDQQRVKKQFKRAEEEAQLQIQEQEEVHKKEQEKQQQQIAELEKENLKYELSHKQQEVTNLLLSSAKQNELLEEIKHDLTRVQTAVRPGNIRELRDRLEKLARRIDINMQNQEVLERVEKEFNMLHNSMMTKLKANYPDLSQNERMMCIYIRMHLLTKEIAPLLNLSVRGVETLRYRLRKKFDLSRDESLADYLKELEKNG